MTNFGEGNCTEAFCTFKMNHECNVFCQAFGLQPFIIAKQGSCKLLVSIHEVAHILPQTKLSGSMISVYKDTPSVGFNPTSHCVYSSNLGNTMLAQSCLLFISANRHIIFLLDLTLDNAVYN
jgi:hypothetical protein